MDISPTKSMTKTSDMAIMIHPHCISTNPTKKTLKVTTSPDTYDLYKNPESEIPALSTISETKIGLPKDNGDLSSEEYNLDDEDTPNSPKKRLWNKTRLSQTWKMILSPMQRRLEFCAKNQNSRRKIRPAFEHPANPFANKEKKHNIRDEHYDLIKNMETMENTVIKKKRTGCNFYSKGQSICND